MYNKKVLQTAVKELDKAKAPAKRKDIITDPMGQWKYPGQVTRIPSDTITMQGVNYPVYGVPDYGQPVLMQPGQDYDFPGANYVDEYPQMRRGGGLKSKKYTRNIEGTNRFFAESALFKKPKKLSKKRIFDPNAKYFQTGGAKTPEEWGAEIRAIEQQIGSPDQWSLEGYSLLQNKLDEYRDWRENTPEGQAVMDSHNVEGEYDVPVPEHLQDYTNAMMKSRLAYANEFGNPAAKRMVNIPDNPYQFEDGNTGTHYMSSMDNYAVPQIQEEDGQLVYGDYDPESNEAIRFENDADAQYFARNYKKVSPGFIEAELTPEQIEEYAKGGFIIEDISVPQLTQAQKGITISDPKEYAYRKAAYDDSMYLYKNNLSPLPKIGPKRLTNKAGDPSLLMPYRTSKSTNSFKGYLQSNGFIYSGNKYNGTKYYLAPEIINSQISSPAYEKYLGSDKFTKHIPANKPIKVDKRTDYYHPQSISNPFTGKATGFFYPGQNEQNDADTHKYERARFKKPVQPVYLKKEGDKESIQKSYNKVGNYNKNTNPNGWISPPKKDQPYEKSRSTINKIPTVDPMGKRRIGETSNATIDPTTGNVTEVITPNYENLLPLKRLETERRNQIIESKVQQRKQSDYKTAYRDQTIVSYDPTIKQFIQTGSRKAPLPYSEKIGTKDWELNTSQEIPESGPLVFQVDGKDYYNEEEARKAQAFMPQGSYKFETGGEANDYMDLELTEDEIQQYARGGFIIEELPKAQVGKETGIESYTSWENAPEEYAPYVTNMEEVPVVAEAAPWAKLSNEYEKKNSKQAFIESKKRDYLKKTNKGLSKMAGLSLDNFPKDVASNFADEYEYKKNNYVTKKLGNQKGFNPRRRDEWVDELTPGERNVVANSKYGSKLQPGYWNRALAGVQELGNTVLPGQPLQYNIPGLTKKEQKEMRDSKLSALEMFAPMDIPGAVAANYLKNNGLSTGSNFKNQPAFYSGEKMSNVTDADAMALNPLTYTGLEAIPELGMNLVKGAKALPGVFKTSTKRSLSIPNELKQTENLIADFTPIRMGGNKYKNAGKEWYHIQPGDYPGTFWDETQKRGLLDAAESLNNSFKKNPNYNEEAFNIGDFNYKQFSEGDEALKKLKSFTTSEPTVGKTNIYNDAEILQRIQNHKQWNNEMDALYQEYQKLDPNASPNDLNDLYPELKKRWNDLQNINTSITDKFITKDQEKFIRDTYPEFIDALEVRNALSNSSLERFAADKLPEKMSDELINLQKSLGLYKKPNNNLFQFEPGKMNKLGGLVKAQVGGSKYDPLVYSKPQVSESTRPNVIAQPNKNIIKQTVKQKTAERKIVADKIKNEPLLTKKQKTEILMSPKKLDEYAYLAYEKDLDTVKEVVPQSNSDRAWEYITNPFTAAEYAISGGGAENMPHNINEMRMAGIDPGVVQGRNIVGNALNMSTNLFDAGDKVVRNVGEGNYEDAALEALRFLPGARLSTGLGKQLVTKTGLLSNANKVNSFAFKSNPEELVDLWRIQEKGARPMAELAAEGKLGKMGNYPAAIKHFKDREEHFGQWFTKDKNDFDFYKADREFNDPEVINLKVPASKLEQYNQYNKSLSRAPDREFVVPFEEQKLYKQLPGSPNAPIVPTKMGPSFGMDMSKYEIKNPDYFTQLLTSYDSKVLSAKNKKFYKDLISSVKKQNGLVTERQYNELQRLKSGNFNFGKKGYADGGNINNYTDLDLTPEEIKNYIDNGYIIEDIE
jgi:hypothetical protein